MRNNIKKTREEIRKERQQNEKLIEIMKKYNDEISDKIARYKLFIGKDKPIIEKEADLYYRAAEILSEIKFFTITGDEEHKEVFITGIPEFAREVCEFFADCEGVSRDNIKELDELTEKEKEAIKKSKTEKLLSDLEAFKNKDEAVLDTYAGKIFLQINKERAFIDLEEGVFEKIMKILDETDEVYKVYTEDCCYINIMIDVESSRSIILYDLLVKAFGRYNMMEHNIKIK